MIQLEGLSKIYGDLVVLRDVTATIQKGEVISIIGPSGTGKSTMLRCLNLLERPSSGKLTFDGIDLLDKSTKVAQVRQRMGMVFQSFNLYAHLTVLENLTLGPIKLRKVAPAAAKARGLDLLALVGLREKADSYPDELSGGQKQRVAIARCLAMEPEVILFDEPTSALDPTMVSEVLGVIRRLAKDGMTMIIVTHEMEFARNISSRVFYMDEGVIYEAGPPQQVFDAPQREKTRIFINRIRSMEYDITSPNYDLYALQGEIQAFSDRHLLGKKAALDLQLLAEEIILLLHDYSDTKLTLSYSEKHGTITCELRYPGAASDIFQEAERQNDIGAKLIHSRCEGYHYRFAQGYNFSTFTVIHQKV